jgi:hypothetical protein
MTSPTTAISATLVVEADSFCAAMAVKEHFTLDALILLLRQVPQSSMNHGFARNAS